MRQLFYVSGLLFFLVSDLVFAAGVKAADHIPVHLRMLLKEIAYIGTDYPEAVKNGKIINAAEYTEMEEFSQSALLQFQHLQAGLSPEEGKQLAEQLQHMALLIRNKAPHQELLELTQDMTKQLTLLFRVPVVSQSSPILALGRRVYQEHCDSCHGKQGFGNGPASQGLEPLPRNFHDIEVMSISSPFKFYNILLTGIEGTAMPSYRALSEEELWSVSFYIAGIRFQEQGDEAQAGVLKSAKNYWKTLSAEEQKQLLQAGLRKDMLATSDDLALQQWLKDHVPSFKPSKTGENQRWLTALRLGAPFVMEVPLGADDHDLADVYRQDTVDEGLNVALEKVRQAKQAMVSSQRALAEQLLLEAYLFGFEKTEVMLSLIDRELVTNIEHLFMDAKAYARQQSPELALEAISELESKLSSIQVKYRSTRQGEGKGGWGDYISSFIIIMREGFEAFLIVAALLALLSGVGETQARLWVHGGWMAALIAGGFSYVLFEQVLKLSGATKESLEAFFTGLAVLLLFYTGFWLLSQAEHQKWNRLVKEKSRKALHSGRLWGLAGIAFVAVYREAVETAVFYSALYRTANSPLWVTAGFLSGCLVLLGICWGIVKFNLKLPLRQFFLATSSLMVGLSIILAGKTMQELIEAGYVQATPLRGLPAIDFLGVYPSVETLLTQLALMLGGVSLAFLLFRKKARNAAPSKPSFKESP